MSSPARAASGTTRYTTVAIILHWTIALGILTLIAMGLIMDHFHLDTVRVFQLYQLHKSIGITVMFLIALRVGWRFAHSAPALPADMPPLEKKGAHLAHLALYGLQVLLPLSGWAMVSVSVLGIPTVLFGTVPWPDLPVLSTLSDKAPVETALKVVHHWASWGLLGLIILHVAAALRHRFVLHDHVLHQMLPSFGTSSTPRQKRETP
ncbi:cytochrome b [Acetobacter orleanensis]|uniref:Cytochrome b561 n=1 Tax=Acetobacter orleanensis TaxID=104099 RepID=A0A4Y3TSQ8_9PROT|nr:cytochrome b [Acetobacter orleanensis]KXV66966.1 cytochrome B [Acetobacter orleanensis]PCD78333.1 cytochrome b [Acetobacter orleanensis]GAN69662.1 cytochrome b561 [Acetobacter orleanensis JCM 7639]GBR28906.1 cytochrome B561 [Acetobacter orleanensis NRIC 0473]GEB84127.1 cytochrome b561 [Acetobacter orleanensis]